ncbi:hypothetical protein F503_03686 [Ophiostoma piceae UAMH 11346]|uniref:EGF-like domain-containing protein n=1 Tax=Ophiostoma piceae (strain UAMH 11346) TaxID=1262450 RepID=S3C053_OPHP1|nr:hypothetical protein F503_03686 [Ophiostoma piceae UAMH 11346]
MSGPQDGEGAQQSATIGSIRRARERAMAGGQRDSFGTFTRKIGQQQQQQELPIQNDPRIAIPDSARRDMAGQAAVGPISPPRAPLQRSQEAGGLSGRTISRPTPAQWPLAGPMPSPADTEPYRPPPGRSEPPQRPPRPSHVPSILDSSRVRDQLPTVFAYNTISQAEVEERPNQGLQPPPNMLKGGRVSDLSLVQPSSASSASRASTISSVGSIPDFPIPISTPVAIPVPPPVAAVPLPRRSINLGPPPSARRGASSFYSNASYVSPIPEESPRTRSHASYASSAAIPGNWGSSSSLALSPEYPDGAAYYDDIPEEGRESSNSGYFEDGSRSGFGSPDGDEMNLVRSASIGQRGKASLVTTTPFSDGTGYVDGSSSSGLNIPTNKSTTGLPLTADNILDAYDAATAVDPTNPSRRSSVSPQPPFGGEGFGGSSRQYSRLSAIRRPPRLDIDAVRKAEARGSMTSLPDLIRRATRLAASLERGKRPASRIDDLSLSPSMYARNLGISSEGNTEKYKSGLSDMLAAFPPPGQPPNRRSMRRSIRDQVGSWPMPYGHRNSRAAGQAHPEDGEYSDVADMKNQRQRKNRRCCGLPLWGFVLTVIVVLIIAAAAIVIPLEFFVIRKQNTKTLAECQAQLTCANGGTNVVSAQGFCSCICTNDFTGFDCTVAGDNGCTTTSVGSGLSNVTLGTAIPRLIEQAQANYSISLSASEILSAFSSGNLSCASENALVTFDGNSVRLSSSGSTEVNAFNAASNDGDDAVFAISGVAVVTVTVEASASAAARLRRAAAGFSTIAGTTLAQITPIVVVPSSTTTVTTTITPGLTTTSTSSSTTSSSSASSSAGSSASSRASSSSSATATGTLSSADPTATFKVTEDILDFARVAVLFILQQESLSSAEGAQSALQRFFSNATTSAKKNVSVADVAQNITLPNGNSINLVDLRVSAGTTLAGVGIS